MEQFRIIYPQKASRPREILLCNTIQFMFQEKEGGEGVGFSNNKIRRHASGPIEEDDEPKRKIRQDAWCLDM